MRLWRVMTDLAGGSQRRFVQLLDGHVEATLDGARLVARAARGEIEWAAAREEMREVEQRGDRFRAALAQELAVAIITPIDREDLFRVSRSIDEVLDNLRDFVRQCDLFGIRDTERMLPVIDEIVAAVEALREAIAAIVDAPREITRRAALLDHAGNRIRRTYDQALADLFRGELTMDLLKTREALRRLDVVGLRLGEAASALSDAAVKRGSH